MSALQEEPEVAQEEATVEFVDLTSKKAAPAVADTFRFDLLLDVEKFDESKLCADIREAMLEASGDRNWYVSVDYSDDNSVLDRYANGNIQSRCIMVWKPGGAPLTSSTSLMVREACLAGIARQPKQSIWTNGVGDLFADTNPDEEEYELTMLHSSVMIDTGGAGDKGSAKKLTYLRWTVSMPNEPNRVVWDDVRTCIKIELEKIGWGVRSTDYAGSGRFGGSTYRWQIMMERNGDKEAPTVETIAKVWEACLTGAHQYRLDHDLAVILQHQGIGSMEIGDQKWEVIGPPPILFVGT